MYIAWNLKLFLIILIKITLHTFHCKTAFYSEKNALVVLNAPWNLNLDYNSINNCHFKLLYIFSILKRYILFREFIDLKILKRISISIIWVGDPNKLLLHNINKQIHLLCVMASEFIHQSYCVMFLIVLNLLMWSKLLCGSTRYKFIGIKWQVMYVNYHNHRKWISDTRNRRLYIMISHFLLVKSR